MQPVQVVMLVRDGMGNRYCPACGQPIERAPGEPAVHFFDGQAHRQLCHECGVKLAPWAIRLVGKPPKKKFVWMASAPPPMEGELEVEFQLVRRFVLPVTTVPVSASLPVSAPMPIRRRK